LNDHVWDTVIAMAVAAHALDPASCASRGKQLKGRVATAVGYAQFLLGLVVRQRLEVDKPSDDQLVELASETVGYLSAMGEFAQENVVVILRELFDGLVEGSPRGIYFVMYATVMLGALCDDPAYDLAALRPAVRAKCLAMTTRYPGQFDCLGLSDP
jgi:hypothetical protein